jgi:hypothetical protein
MTAVRTTLNVLAGVAVAAALGFAWWSSRNPADPAPPAPAAAPRTHRAPFEAYAQAVAGDWRAIKGTNKQPPGMHYALVEKQPPPGDVAVTVLFTVKSVDAERVIRAMRGRVDATGETKDEPEATFPRSGLTLEQLLDSDWKIDDLVVTDEPRVVGDHTFQCKKLVYRSTDPMLPRKKVMTELWLSSEVPAGGLVAFHETQDLDAMHFEMTQEIIGFGTSAGASWGAKPEL